MTPNQQHYIPGRGLPLAPPLAPRDELGNDQVSGLPRTSPGTNTPVTSSPEGAGPVGAKRLTRIEAGMPPRDREVLLRVAEHRYLSTLQVTRFVFTGHASDESAARTARTVLARLERLGLLRALARRIGGFGAGSAAKLWQLAPAGARLLRADGTTHRTFEPSPRFLLHCLAVADMHLLLRDLADRPDVERVTVQTEPDCWRPFSGPGGQSLSLQPDLAATIASADYDDHWFVEVDLGTESLPTVLRKCARYEAYRATGAEQETLGAFPLVLWFFLDGARADRVQRTIARTPRLTPQLYRVATPETVTAVLAGASA